MGSCQSVPQQSPHVPRRGAGPALDPVSEPSAGTRAPSAGGRGVPPSRSPGTPSLEQRDARQQQELDDEALARRLVMEELAAIGGDRPRARLGAEGGVPALSGPSPAQRAARAACPFCGAQNEFTTPATQGPLAMRCGQCAGQFQVALPSSLGGSGPEHAAPSTSLRVCRRCGATNSFPTPAPGQPTPDVLCGICGAVAPVAARTRRGGARTAESRLAEQMSFDPPQGLMQMGEGPMVRVNVGGQRRIVPLMLLLELMREEAEMGNPAQPSDIEALPTRKLATTENLGEQKQCLVCLEEFGNGDDVKTLPCLHIYHQRCIEQWLGTNNSCPVCKTPIGREERRH